MAKVDIDLSRQKEESADLLAKRSRGVKETLADVWNTSPEHIALNIEGGDAKRS
ncbi:hypothetical protein ACEQPO_18760 [Bacillus sp. SL00103]